MANVYATKSGNWSDTTVWNTLALPTANDDVFANNFTVYINQDINVLSLRNIAGAGITAGGFFVLNHNIIARASGGVYTGPVTPVRFLSASPFFSTFVGDITGSSTTSFVYGGINSSTGTLTISGNLYTGLSSLDRAGGVNNASTGTLTVYGSAFGGRIINQPGAIINSSSGVVSLYGAAIGYEGAGDGGYGIYNFSTGPVYVYGQVLGGTRAGIFNVATGNVYVSGSVFGRGGGVNGPGIYNNSFGNNYINGTVGGGSGSNSYGVYNLGNGFVYITGNVVGGLGSNAHGVLNNLFGFVNITGNAIGGTGSNAYGAVNNATGFIYVQGTAIGNGWGSGSSGIGGASPGIFGSQTGTTIVQSLCCGPRGQWPTGGNIFILPQQNSTMTFETSAFQDVVLFTSLSANITPPVSSVRLGTKYNLNDYTGTCAIPSVSSVLQGVAVDNSTGIAALQPQTVWSVQTSAIDTNSLGGRLKESATVQSFGQMLTAFNM